MRICDVILLALDEVFDVGGRGQPQIMAQLANLTAPEVTAAARLPSQSRIAEAA